MKNKLISALLLALTGCTTLHSYDAAPQFYRAKGQEDQLKITGKINQKFEDKFVYGLVTNKVTIFFNDQPQIEGYLDKQQTGDLTGQPYNGKPVSASCSSKLVSENWRELKCIVFIDNERAATLTM